MKSTNSNNTWFTSDSHFGHRNVLRYCDRPFEHIHAHDESLIQRWNSVVKPKDVVYHLGDFALAGKKSTKSILNRLSGNIIFIPGNHDRVMESLLHPSLVKVEQLYEITVFDEELKLRQSVVLCHFPLERWNRSNHGSWHLHGHSHGNLPSGSTQMRLDVGVDQHDYTPVSYNIIKEHMMKKTIQDDTKNNS